MNDQSMLPIFMLLGCFVLLVTGCGGGSTMTPDRTVVIDQKPQSPTLPDDLTKVIPMADEAPGEMLGNRPEAAAQAVPSQGSVFQSSETSNGVTRGTFNVEHIGAPQDWQPGSYIPLYKFTYDDGNGGKRILDETAAFVNIPQGGGENPYSGSVLIPLLEHCVWSDCTNKPQGLRHPPYWSSFNLERNENGSSTMVKYFADFEESPEDNPDADYMVFGYWLHVPEDAVYENDTIVGVFADGGDPFDRERLNSLTGTARYIGDTAGFYRERQVGGDADGTNLFSTHFTGKATLTANFDGAGSGHISGEITNLTIPLRQGVSATSFILERTSLDDFMTGNTQAEAEALGATDWEGKWGGQFYGNGTCVDICSPSSIAGTFGATSRISDGENGALSKDRTMLGAFGAYLQE